jgi:hypothetical protein
MFWNEQWDILIPIRFQSRKNAKVKRIWSPKSSA